MIFCKNPTSLSLFSQTNFPLNQRKYFVTTHKQIRYLLEALLQCILMQGTSLHGSVLGTNVPPWFLSHIEHNLALL